MGLSIHDSGRIKKPKMLPLLMEEVKEILNVYGWKCQLYAHQFVNNSFEQQDFFYLDI